MPSITAGATWQWGTQTYYAPFYVINKLWANRAQPSNAFWDLQDGVPLEIVIALCNKLQANCHINVPLMYSDSDIQAMATACDVGHKHAKWFQCLGSSAYRKFRIVE